MLDSHGAENQVAVRVHHTNGFATKTGAGCEHWSRNIHSKPNTDNASQVWDFKNTSSNFASTCTARILLSNT
jgi:hypothetical protein